MKEQANAGKRAEPRPVGSRGRGRVNSRWIGFAAVLVVIATALGLCPRSNAQSTSGQFNGHVVDATGAAIPEAMVTLLDVQTGVARSTTSNSGGEYLFPLVSPGEYKLTVGKAGFSTATNPPFRLEVNQNVTQDFTLTVGSASETVTVTSASELLDATSATVGNVVESRAVADLPLNGRSFSALLTLAPGVNPVNYSQNSGVGYGTGFGSAGIPGSTYTFPATQGQWNRENLYYLDGIINTAAFASSYDVPPIVDAIQEFKIQSHNDQSEYGGVLGGVVNVVSKSGTNNYHGALWEYLRNNIFDARNPFTDVDQATLLPTPTHSFRQNEFGGAVGGPVLVPKLYNGRNKTFFFASYEGWRYAKAAGLRYVSPTAAELNGDFTHSSIAVPPSPNAPPAPPIMYDPYSTTPTGKPGQYTRSLLGGDGLHVPANLIDPTAQAFLKAYSDTPTFTPSKEGDDNTILNLVGTDNANELNFRGDQNFGSTNTLFFRYSSLDGTNTQPNSQHATTDSSADQRNWGGGYTHTFSPTLILDAVAGYSGRFNAVAVTKAPSAVGSPLYANVQSVYGFVNFGFIGYNGIGGNGPSGSESHEFNFAANASWIRGNHQIRFGFEEQIPEMTQGLSGGHFGGAAFSFSTPETADPQNASSTGNALAGALLGLPDNGRFQSEVNGVRIVAASAYIQDSWKVTPKLTLNGGLRWDGSSSPHLLDKTTAASLDPATGNWIVSGGKLPPACDVSKGIFAPCIPSTTPENNAIIAAHVTVAANPNLGPDPNYRNFGPRFGFAYKFNNSIVVSGGYSMIYDNLTSSIQSVRDRLLAWPSNSSLPLTFNVIGQPLDSMTDIVPTLSSTNALPAVPTPFNQFGWYYDTHLKSPYSHQLNLEIQKQITSSLVATIGYVGSTDHHLPITGIANNSPEPGGAGLDRPFPWSGTAIMSTSRGTSNYNALQARVDKRFTDGLSFGTGFTWSKSMDNAGGGFYGVEDGPLSYATFQNYNNVNANYGISGNSLKLLYYGWALYELPVGKDKQFLNHGVASQVLGGWQINTNLSAHSGVPLGFPDAGTDPANIGNTSFFNYARANINGSPKLHHPTKSEAFNTAVFSDPKGTYGNSGRGVITASNFDNIDLSLMKEQHITETVGVQFRAEFFNAFNIQNYGNPGVTYGGNNFGVITALAPGANPRQIQFSLRGNF